MLRKSFPRKSPFCKVLGQGKGARAGKGAEAGKGDGAGKGAAKCHAGTKRTWRNKAGLTSPGRRPKSTAWEECVLRSE